MSWLGDMLGGPKPEQRSSPESINSSATAAELFAFFGLDSGGLPGVTIDRALKVPAFSAAYQFLPSSLANLPLHGYRDKGGKSERVGGALQRVLNEAPNGEWSSFGARKYFWQQVFGQRGRGLMWIERSANQVIGLWPMDPTKVTVKKDGVRKVYEWRDGSNVKRYPASEIIDVPFMLKADQISTYTTLTNGERAIQLALAMNEYGSTFFAGGGVPPLALVGPMPAGPDAMKRALDQTQRAIDEARKSGKPIVNIPTGYDLKPIGIDPEKGQMEDARRFQVEEIARIFNLPPVFLQDLTNGTFSNTEQQDLHLVKHLIAQWAKALEDELNLKLFGAENNRRYVEHSLDGLMRGAMLERMQAHGQAVQNAIRTPNEVRALENLPPLPNGDDLMIQGATVPLGTQPQEPGTPPPATGNDDET